MTFLIVPASRNRFTRSSANAAVCTSSCEAPRGNSSVARSLPFTWMAMVTVSSTSSAVSCSGHAAYATVPVCPSRCQSSSARCGPNGASSSTNGSSSER